MIQKQKRYDISLMEIEKENGERGIEEVSRRDEKKALLSAASADTEERKGRDYRVDWK